MFATLLAVALFAQDPVAEFAAEPGESLSGVTWERGECAGTAAKFTMLCDFVLGSRAVVVPLIDCRPAAGSEAMWKIERGVFGLGREAGAVVPLDREVRAILTAVPAGHGVQLRLFLGGVMVAGTLASGIDAERCQLGRNVALLGGKGGSPAGLQVQRIRIWDQALQMPEIWRLGQAGAPDVVCGPMLGAVAPDAVELWAHLARIVPVVALVRGPDGRTARFPLRASAGERIVARARLSGLRPAARYEYELRVAGAPVPGARGTFRTAPEHGIAAEFTLAVASCAKWQVDPVQPLWHAVVAERPAFQLLIGDTAYVDSTAAEDLWAGQVAQRRVPAYAHALRNVPTLAIWDDHDYGPNDSDGTAAGKEESLATWQQTWANPSYGTEGVPGVFTSLRYGDVEVFLTDGRFHRSPNFAPDTEQKTMLGPGQLAWLIDAVSRSKAAFKLIANGSTWYESEKDGWRLFPAERRRLLGELGRRRVGGVLFLSGDVHHCAVRMHPTEALLGYRMPEVVSSGIGQTPGGFSQLRGVQTEDKPEWRGPPERRGQSFAFLDFLGGEGARAVRVRLIGPGGEETYAETIPLATLQAPTGG